jgi:hypothetical protein
LTFLLGTWRGAGYRQQYQAHYGHQQGPESRHLH